jgi:hypothetical protein
VVPLRNNNPERWRKRAEEARALARQMTDFIGGLEMMEVADEYDRLADSAEQLAVRATHSWRIAAARVSALAAGQGGQMPKLSSDQRRALAMLDCNPSGGCTEPLLRSHGFKPELLAELIIARLATAEEKRMMAGGKAADVRWFSITAAGQRALMVRSPHQQAR